VDDASGGGSGYQENFFERWVSTSKSHSLVPLRMTSTTRIAVIRIAEMMARWAQIGHNAFPKIGRSRRFPRLALSRRANYAVAERDARQ
jgi:hypothetical protein